MNWYWPRRVLPRFFPAAGAVEYAIDYTTDRGGSRCLRLIPIPRNHRCRPRVRFNIFDRYLVCSLPSIIPPYTHTHRHTHTHTHIYIRFIIPLLPAKFSMSTSLHLVFGIKSRCFELFALLLRKKVDKFALRGSRAEFAESTGVRVSR